MSSASRFGRAALAYATKLGLSVFPLAPRKKQPDACLTPHGFLEASRDSNAITAWWKASPSANVAVACAASDLVVIDVDPRNGGDETFVALTRELGELPSTWTVLTPGGGTHLYLKHSGGRIRPSLGPGIDLKHQGYVVAPPSVHPNGRTYVWDVGVHPLESVMASPPESWRARMVSGARRPPLPAPAYDARASFLGAAFEVMGWLGPSRSDGRRIARCPWAAQHSDSRGDGGDSSTILFPASSESMLGGFCCLHAHCAERSLVDVIRTLPPAAIDAGARAFPRAYRQLVWRLAAERQRRP